MSNNILRTRGYLPHLEIPQGTYFITIRLADTLPFVLLEEFRTEIARLSLNFSDRKFTAEEDQRSKYLLSKKIQDYLDNGAGECWLKQPAVARLILEAVSHHDGASYISHVCCVMPNHLHWILTPIHTGKMSKMDSRLIPIVQRFKSYTAHAANKLLVRTGPFWAREYYDHCIRNSEELDRLIRYTLNNPVKARLCENWNEWAGTICSEQVREAFTDLPL